MQPAVFQVLAAAYVVAGLLTAAADAVLQRTWRGGTEFRRRREVPVVLQAAGCVLAWPLYVALWITMLRYGTPDD